MLVSRKRARLDGLEAMGDKSLLRDVGAAPPPRGDELVGLLRRLQQRDGGPADHASPAAALPQRTQRPQMPRARPSAQELFLSVVLEWQQAPSATASSASTSASDEDEDEDDEDDEDTACVRRKGRATPPATEEVSPTSVHNIPRDLTPLSLDPASATPTAKHIGAYSPRARQVLLTKYMAKRARRLSQSKVRYGVRKTLANARPRVKGRFVKTEQPLTAAAVEAAAAGVGSGASQA